MRKGRRPSAVSVTPFPKALSLWAPIATACLLIFSVSGCKKASPKPSAAKIHTITQQLAAEATANGATVRIKKSAADNDAASRDGVDIRLPAGSALDDPKTVAGVLQRIEKVATANGLTQDEATRDGNAIKLTLRRSGAVTHEVTIENSSARYARSDGAAAKLAIILDDLGSDRAVADAIFAIPYKLTVSILPDQPHSQEIAQEAHRRGFEVMLHLPMESVGKERPEVQELRSGMPESRVATLVADFLARVPYATGVNNHQGSQATADAALMSELMPILRDKGLFYIDSRTTAATVAYDAAQRDGVPSTFRNVPFLDDVEEVGAVRKQLELAFRGAKEKGEAIAIGHPHAATREVLAEMLPRAQKDGIELVRASELVH